jgi:hypothetical protein
MHLPALGAGLKGSARQLRSTHGQSSSEWCCQNTMANAPRVRKDLKIGNGFVAKKSACGYVG